MVRKSVGYSVEVFGKHGWVDWDSTTTKKDALISFRMATHNKPKFKKIRILQDFNDDSQKTIKSYTR